MSSGSRAASQRCPDRVRRLAAHGPWLGCGTGRAARWMALSLKALSDAFFGRLVYVRGQASRAGAVSLTTHFHVGADALASQEAGQVLGVADARRLP